MDTTKKKVDIRSNLKKVIWNKGVSLEQWVRGRCTSRLSFLKTNQIFLVTKSNLVTLFIFGLVNIF